MQRSSSAWMARTYQFELAAGWRQFALSNGERTVRLVTGMLFPPLKNGRGENWIIFAEWDEVLPLRKGTGAT